MATEKIIKVTANTESAVKDVEKLNDTTKDLGSTAEKSSEKATKGTRDIGKAAQKSEKSVKNVGKGFKILGGAMKAAGIGLVVALVAKLTQALSQNQKVVDTVSGIFETINIVFTQFTNALIDAFESANDATNGFEALGKVLSGLLTIALTPMKLAFNGIKLAIQQGQLAWEKSFFGDGDPKTIKELNAGIKETQDTIKQTGLDAIEAGSDVVNNFADAIGEIKTTANAITDEVSKVSISAAQASSDRIIQLRKEAEIAEAQLAGLTLKFQKQAEELRQERDDIRLSIEERIKANEELGKVLTKQSEEELELANKRLALAREELRVNPERTENIVAYQNALNGVADVEERITGQKSEQRVNEAALLEERKANLNELQKIGATERELAEEEALQEAERQRQLIERTVTEEARKKELLLNVEREYQNSLAEIEAEAISKKSEAEQKKREEEQKTEEARRKVIEQRLQQEEILKQQTIQMTAQTFGAIANILGEQSKAGKAFAVAQALINTYQGITAAVASAPFPFNVPAITAAAVTGFGAVKNIVSTNVDNPSSSAGGASSANATRGTGRQAQTPQVRAPEFNVVGDSGTNQIADVLGRQTNKPQRAYVVSKDISSQQELDRNIKSGSSLG